MQDTTGTLSLVSWKAANGEIEQRKRIIRSLHTILDLLGGHVGAQERRRVGDLSRVITDVVRVFFRWLLISRVQDEHFGMQCIRDDRVGVYDQHLVNFNYWAVVEISQREQGLHAEWWGSGNVVGIGAGVELCRQKKALGPLRSIDFLIDLVVAQSRHKTDDDCLNQG